MNITKADRLFFRKAAQKDRLITLISKLEAALDSAHTTLKELS